MNDDERPGCPRCDSLTRLVGDICGTCFDELVDAYDKALEGKPDV